MRLDKFLAEQGFYETRTRAERAIKESCVIVNGKTETKPSFDVCENDQITALPDPLEYVSRGALKLAFAFEKFNLSVENKVCVDIGASTGGFCDVLLRNGAEKVFAVDVGKGQLSEKIKENPKIVNLEKTDVRALTSEFDEIADFVSSDCSFISLTHVLPKAFEILKEGGEGVFLIKPQFELAYNDKGYLSKNGILKDDKKRREGVEKVLTCAKNVGFEILENVIESPIKGTDGNIEYLLYLGKKSKD